MIEKEDGASKNDCEQNAARRFAEGFRRKHPRPETVVLRDGPAWKGPRIKLLRFRGSRYILGARPGDRGFLFDRAKDSQEARTPEKTERAKKGRIAHEFRWPGGAPPDETRFDVRADLPEYAEARPDGSKASRSRAADLPLGEAAANPAVREARSRRRIENETFNALKNHRCEFEHNFGHGEKPVQRLRQPMPAGVPDRPDPEALLRDVQRGEAVPGAQAPSLAGAAAMLLKGQDAGPVRFACGPRPPLRSRALKSRAAEPNSNRRVNCALAGIAEPFRARFHSCCHIDILHASKS
ncbi:MAG: hypothetical protein OXI01_15330 [Albidovulum sp.]|nr:hypothetical protein [Albidovulum sp.]